ncbi:hypothetical protein JW935_00890 [candidate division KSB1 bacterium]|nr:hypothetical protein [candidate division KSB1 bacterium]
MADRFFDAGQNNMTWENRGKIASGVYYYALESNGFRQMKTALLLK